MSNAHETSNVMADYGSVQSRANRVNERLNDQVQSESTPKGGTADVLNNANSQDIGTQFGHLYLGPQSKSRYVSSTFFAVINQEGTDVDHLLQQQQQQYTFDPELYIRQEEQDYTAQSRSRHRGSISTYNASLYSQTISGQLYGDLFPPLPAWSVEDITTKSTTRIYNAEVTLDDIPSKEQCEELFRTYMQGYHTISPLFHGPSFLKQARRVNERNTKSNMNVELHFLALHAAVLFAGCAICSRKRLSEIFGGQSRESLSSRFYRRAVQAIRLTNFPQTPSLYTLSAFMIIDTMWLREEQPLNYCSLIGLAVRIAQILGLHKDPTIFAALSPIDIQIRRQLWWAIVALDTQVAIAAGLPPIIDCNSYQVQEPNEIPEEMTHLDADSQFQKSIPTILVGGKIKFYKNVNRILRVLHSNTFSRESLDYVLDIMHASRADLAARQQKICEMEIMLASPLSTTNGNDEVIILHKSQSSPSLARFAKELLALFATKPFTLIQGPVKGQKLEPYLYKKDPQAILRCKEYLQVFLKIVQSSEFQPWHWCWPGQHQPLHAILLLIMHLERCPDNSTTQETRRLVDLAIFMCGPQENNGVLSSEDGCFDSRPLSGSGSKAWEFIRQARANVWTKAGLDPVILNCPEQAEDVNINRVEEYLEMPTPVPTPLMPLQVEFPLQPLEPWSGENHDWYNVDFNGNFNFDASLSFTGHI
ncbi:hypothetical protein N431DRAFT_559228 [Stipitochalara longipes BDJ]|nr:hypothetical protein N431DRAFT_559228 [Stipitochalara longipes BDJ]